MSTYKELLYDGPPISRVKGIQFCILSPQDIIKRSFVEVTRNASYSGNEPDVNGLYDSRMGVVDHGKICRTCLQKREFCPGHFGHIVMAKPVFFVQFLDIVRKILKSVCFRCSKVLVNPEAPHIRAILRRNCSRQKRWDLIHKECTKVKKCECCGAKQPDRVSEVEQKLRLEWRDSNNTATSELVMGAEDVLRVFKRITEEDAEVLGFSSRFNRPEWMICTVLPVPPPSLRPSVRSDTGQRSEDDLTHILSDIVKWNTLLASKIEKGASYETIENHAIVLQYHVSTLVDNSVPTMLATSKDRTGRTLRTLVDRLKSKEGRIRGNLMGKRVDFSARTVITPDPNLSIDELGVPMQIATNLTFPEIVSRGNFDRMRQLVRNGPEVHPGAKHVRKARQGMRTIRLKGNDTAAIEAELELGDVVERHLQNGDYVLFNRQPSLHKMSMMAHRVRVMPNKTFRLNVCVCASYNADFDGDEMNMHLPQSLQTHEEIKNLAAVSLHIISPRNSKPIITIAQDVLLGVFRMTLPGVHVAANQFMNLTCSNRLYDCRMPEPSKAFGNEMGAFTGQQLLSTVIPPNTNHRGSLGNDGDESKRVVIRDGEIVQGAMQKSTYDAASRGLVHSIFNDKGADAVTAFLNNTQKLVCDWLVLSGFSVGVSDLVVGPEVRKTLRNTIDEMKAGVYSIIREVHNDRFENKGTGKNADFFEKVLTDVISSSNKDLQKAARSSFQEHDNRMINMIKDFGAGSKGSIINFVQMVACVGQQTVDNKRVVDGFDSRTLPHFTKFDDGPNSRGFVENSFITGLTPNEFFFHSMGGRIGLIDTAVRTSETGYLQRKLVKSMEDCKVNYDMTVRNAAGQIVQYVYGEDGADAAKIEYHSLPYMEMEDADLRRVFLIAHSAELGPFLQAPVLARLQAAEKDLQRAGEEHYARLLEDRRFVTVNVHRGKKETRILFPVHVARIVENTAQLLNKYGVSAHQTDLDPLYVLERIAALEREAVFGGSYHGAKPEPVPLFGVLLRCFLSPKPLIVKHRLSRLAFDRVVQVVRATFIASLAQPGEVVGITAAQSIGEPTTQLSTLFSSRVLIHSQDSRTSDASTTPPSRDTSMYSGAMGAFIDRVLAGHPSQVVDLGGNSVVMDLLPGQDYYIVGVSNQEKTSWKRISQVSRHPANGGMVRVHTKSGKTTCATLSHSFLKRTTNSIEPVKGHDLKLGDRIPVARSIPVVENPMNTITIGDTSYELTRDLGWFFGAYLADGSVSGDSIRISKIIPEYQNKLRNIARSIFTTEMTQREKVKSRGKLLNGRDMSVYDGMENIVHHPHLASFLVEEFRKGSFQKRVPAFVYASNLEFIRGVIGGYFDGDGNVGTGQGKSTIRSASVSEELTEDFILLLAYVGIFASKCREKNKDNSDLITVQVLRRHAPKFKEEVGFVVWSKAQALDALVEYVQREDAHNVKEETDMVPELGDTLATVGKLLKLDGQSRLYGRFTKKEAIGRSTLLKFLSTFEEDAFNQCVEAGETYDDNVRKLQALREFLGASVPDGRDRIDMPPHLGKLLEEVGEAVKERGKKAGGEYARAAKCPRITVSVWQRYLQDLAAANVAKRDSVTSAVDEAEPHIEILRQAAHADVVWDEIVGLERLEDPGEMVYDFTVPGNDSFMVDCGVLVHNTLNSVHYDEELLLCVDGKLERVSIGDFTHRTIDGAAPDALEKHPKDTDLAWVRGADVKVLSCDEDGKVAWQTVEAVTRHPVINEDGSDTLLHVRTRTGREVRATRGKSFLKRIGNKIVPIKGSELGVGDRVPVSTVLPARDVAAIDYLRVEDYLPPTDWLFMSHVEAALAVRAEGKRKWYSTLEGRGIHVPYERCDAFTEAFVGAKGRAPKRAGSVKSGCVYTAHTSLRGLENTAHVPERIPLDEDFGWLVGAYLAEGCIANAANKQGAPKRPYALLICNMQPEFKERFVRFCETYNIGYHVDAGTRRMPSGNLSPTVSLRMHSYLLGQLFTKMFGTGAENKRIDPVLFGAPDVFLRGVLDGYWSGDGHVSKHGVSMSAYSANGKMLQDLQQVMIRFGIPTSLSQQSQRSYEHNVSRFESTSRGWTLGVPACGCVKFRQVVDLCVASKRQRLEEKHTDSTRAAWDTVPDVELSKGRRLMLSRHDIADMLQNAEDPIDADVLRRIAEEDIFYDEVVSIEAVPNAGRDRAYDLTVANSHTFALLNGLYSPNTFHLAGISSASGTITQGVPRLRELFNVSKKIKTPRMEIYARPEYAADMERVTEIKNSIQTTRFRELVKSSCVYYDPSDDPERTMIPEDRDVLRMHAAFSTFAPGCDRRKSPWLLRFEFDRMRMLEKQVFFTDINFALHDHYKDDTISCVFSDDNSDRLVCRARLIVPDNADRNDILTDVLALEQSILENLIIKGVKDIDKAVLEAPKENETVYDDISGTFVKRNEWRIITDGTNLVEVMANPYVDYTRTRTNHVTEILGVLGIEATRAALFDELQSVMWMSDSENVNYRHMALLVDTMTNRGHLVPIDRHGINKGDIGPLAKCSFEETDEMLIRAGVFCEMDKINGVSANIMLGQVPPCGTGEGDIVMDMDALADVDRSKLDDAYSAEKARAEAAAAFADAYGEDEYADEMMPEAPLAAFSADALRLPEPDRNLAPKEEDDIILRRQQPGPGGADSETETEFSRVLGPVLGSILGRALCNILLLVSEYPCQSSVSTFENGILDEREIDGGGELGEYRLYDEGEDGVFVVHKKSAKETRQGVFEGDEEDKEDNEDKVTSSPGPDKKQQYKHCDAPKLALVLDMDHTLVHSVTRSDFDWMLAHDRFTASQRILKNLGSRFLPSHDGCYTLPPTKSNAKADNVTFLRPGVREFLEKAAKMFDEVHLFTMAEREYTSNVIRIIQNEDDPDPAKRMAFIRSVATREDRNTLRLEKSLDVLGLDPLTTVVVDDFPEVWRPDQRENVVRIAPFRVKSVVADNEAARDAELSRIMTDVLKPLRASFHRAHGLCHHVSDATMARENSQTDKESADSSSVPVSLSTASRSDTIISPPFPAPAPDISSRHSWSAVDALKSIFAKSYSASSCSFSDAHEQTTPVRLRDVSGKGR